MLRFRKRNRVVGGKLRELRNQAHEIRSEDESSIGKGSAASAHRLSPGLVRNAPSTSLRE